MIEELIQKWIAEGTITQDQAAVMREDISMATRDSSSNKFLAVISIIGAIFLGIGIIWIVASNWDGMHDFLKILILMASTGSVLYAGYEIGFRKMNFPKTGHALVFLSAILFGASTFLIGQIYNVEAHAAFLSLIWLIGIIPLVYVFQSAILTVLACVVFCIWFNSYAFKDFSDFNALSVAFIGFFYQTFGILLFGFGSMHYFVERYNKVARAYRLVGIYLALPVLLVLTFKNSYQGLEEIGQDITANPLMISAIFFVGAVFIAINYWFNPSGSKTNRIENGVAFIILTAIYTLNLVIDQGQLFTFFWFLFNLFYVGLVVVLFKIGYDRMDMKLVNVASLGTFVFVITKFFDIFSNLLDNGLTWLIFGIILIAGSIWFERKRRQIRDNFTAQKSLNKDNGQ